MSRLAGGGAVQLQTCPQDAMVPTPASIEQVHGASSQQSPTAASSYVQVQVPPSSNTKPCLSSCPELFADVTCRPPYMTLSLTSTALKAALCHSYKQQWTGEPPLEQSTAVCCNAAAFLSLVESCSSTPLCYCFSAGQAAAAAYTHSMRHA